LETAGQERFQTITTSYYRGAHGLILVFDVTSRTSFDNTAKWLDDVERHAAGNIVRLLVGNKCDLENRREIEYSEGKALAEKLGLQYIETSAKEDTNVDKAFMTLSQQIMKLRGASN
jgi:small GTP-binding protein